MYSNINIQISFQSDWLKMQKNSQAFKFNKVWLTLFFSRCGISFVRRQTRWRSITIVLLKYVLSPPLSSPASRATCPAITSLTARLNTVMISVKLTGGGLELELSLPLRSMFSLSKFASWICPRERPEHCTVIVKHRRLGLCFFYILMWRNLHQIEQMWVSEYINLLLLS